MARSLYLVQFCMRRNFYLKIIFIEAFSVIELLKGFLEQYNSI